MKKYIIIIIFILVCILSLSFVFLKKEKNAAVNNDVNIVFTTDKNYKEYLKTAIYSLIKNKNPDTIYNINILCVDFDKKDLTIYDRYNSETVHIKTIPLNLAAISHVGNYVLHFHVTRADLYKFFMPEIFPDLDKILYMDADILVLGDLSKLYNTNLRNKYIGVVHNNNSKKTYNCGVILYNLKAWRKNDLTNKLIDAKNNDTKRTLMTQNAFNDVIKFKNFYSLPYIYNVWAYAEKSSFKYYIKKTFNLERTKIKTVEDYLKSAVIVHFYIYPKPWAAYWDTAKADNDSYVKMWREYNTERIKNEKK